MAKILMICGDYCEDYETMVPYQTLLAVGHEVDAVSPGKKAAIKLLLLFMILRGSKRTQKNAGTFLP